MAASTTLSNNLRQILHSVSIALIQVQTKRQDKVNNQWLSTKALSARKERRHLRRTYSKNRTSANRQAYHQPCCKQVDSSPDCAARIFAAKWTVPQTTHIYCGGWWVGCCTCTVTSTWYKDLDTKALATGVVAFFIDKVRQVKFKIEVGCRSNTSILSDKPCFTLLATVTLTFFSLVTLNDIYYLIRFSPIKTSPRPWYSVYICIEGS